MSAPKRLIEEGTAFDRSLLGAHRAERPSSDYERRVIAAAGLASSTAMAAEAARPSLLARLANPRLVAIAALGIGSAMLVASKSERTEAPISGVVAKPAQPGAETTTRLPVEAPPPVVAPPPVIAVTTPDALPSAPPAAPAAVIPAAPSVAAVAAAARAPAEVVPEAPSTTGASLQREVELLDTVKRSLRAGASAEAARALDAYDAEFAGGSLKPEAGFLRIRLLLAKGDRAGAAALGDELLRRYPNSVHAKRIRAVLDAGDTQTPASPR